MASLALDNYLVPLLQDSEHLLDVAIALPANSLYRSLREAALHRAIIVTAVSAWEAYIEELVREAITLLRPPAPPMGLWPTHNAAILGQLPRFNNPNFENVRMLIADSIGLPNIQAFRIWANCTSVQAREQLADVIRFRHEVAHGVHPRPNVAPHYAGNIPNYFRQLGRCTDQAVRDHLVQTLGIANPWPP